MNNLDITIFNFEQLWAHCAACHPTNHLPRSTSLDSKYRLCIAGGLLGCHLWLPGPKTLFLDRYYFHPRVCVCVCVFVSVCVCVSVYIDYLQKVLDRFRWNLAGWCIMIKCKFLSKMSWIGSLERKLQRICIYYFSLLRPFDYFFLRVYLPLFYLLER